MRKTPDISHLYTHTHMSIYTLPLSHTHTHVYIYMHIYLNIHMYEYIRTYILMCANYLLLYTYCKHTYNVRSLI